MTLMIVIALLNSSFFVYCLVMLGYAYLGERMPNVAWKRLIICCQRRRPKIMLEKDKTFTNPMYGSRTSTFQSIMATRRNIELSTVLKISEAQRELECLKEKKNISDSEDKKEFKKVVRDVKVPDQISIQELSNRMAERSSDIIKFLFNMKVVATINHVIDKDTAEYIVKEFGHKPIIEEAPSLEINKKQNLTEGDVKKRPPVVTIMGHVDHGKTSLLDSLRDTSVVSGEHGGITQHIGAYQIKTENNQMITFIDTPGHAAFTQMRARGSKVTDIVVLVIAADDGIKPQTVEAIQHSKAAKVPIIVAINKCDLPNKNISKIKNDLMQYELIAEDLSGDTLFVEVSASKKTNLDKLKETIILQSDILDLKATVSGPASGTVLESKIDKGKGPVSTVLISSGLLKKGDHFVCGNTWGKIRAIINHDGKSIDEALPSMPVEILGMNDSAFAGAEFLVTDENKAEKYQKLFEKRRDELIRSFDREEQIKMGLENEYVFRIHLGKYGEYEAPADMFDEPYLITVPINERITAYLSGMYFNLDKAIEYQKEMKKKGYLDAYIVAYRDGDKIDL